MSRGEDDPVPPSFFLNLDDAFRVLEALEDALLTWRKPIWLQDFKTSWQPSSG